MVEPEFHTDGAVGPRDVQAAARKLFNQEVVLLTDRINTYGT
jgi:hypothetical protein